MTKQEIVARMAERKEVEGIVKNICKVDRRYLDDLSQMVYEVLLLYDDDVIIRMYERGELRFFVARIVTNQYYSHTSNFHYLFRHAVLRSVNASVANNIEDGND